MKSERPILACVYSQAKPRRLPPPAKSSPSYSAVTEAPSGSAPSKRG